MGFPTERPRRLRRTETIRRMVRETHLRPEDFIWPMFVVSGQRVRQPIGAMPGVERMSRDIAAEEAKKAYQSGIPAVILFGIPDMKDAEGSSSWDDNGVVQEAVRAIKDAVPEMMVITDVCLCEYTDHGHCGVIIDGEVNNDDTLKLLARQAVSHCQAGADIVAPSDMMDGRVGAVRKALDKAGYYDRAIMAYSAKYASAFYGPFREAADSTPQFGDRKGYQMDPPNVREALKEVRLDLEEGADMVMVKPALAYLDVIAKVKASTDVPVAAYNVSGEYSMVKAAAQAGFIDEKRIVMEILTGIKRAGADLILTYHAPDVVKWIDEDI
ncbi:MAG: porphobilinogen synthase [candidate division Zixibacteria bacterium]|nr:porphobilinogen synthase [Candidatus Tariuqbacter arcticus]